MSSFTSTASTLYSDNTRCPRGSRKNKLTKKCIRNSVLLREKNERMIANAPRLLAKLNAPKRSRCPNGQRKNRKTKRCEPHARKVV